MNKRFAVFIIIIFFYIFNCFSQEKKGKFLFLGFDLTNENIPSQAFDKKCCEQTARQLENIAGVPAYYIDSILTDALNAFTIEVPENISQNTSAATLSDLKAKLKVKLKDEYKKILHITNNSFFNEDFVQYLQDKIEITFDTDLEKHIKSGEIVLNSQEAIEQLINSAKVTINESNYARIIKSQQLLNILNITATIKVKIMTEQRHLLKDEELRSSFQDRIDKLFMDYENEKEKARQQYNEQNEKYRNEKDNLEIRFNQSMTEIEKQQKNNKTINKQQINEVQAKYKKEKESLEKKINDNKEKYKNNLEHQDENYRKEKEKIDAEINKKINQINKRKKSLAAVEKEIKIEYITNYFYYPSIEYISFLTNGEPIQIVRDFKENKTVKSEDIINYLPSSLTRYIFNDWKTLGNNGISKTAKNKVIEEAKFTNNYISAGVGVLNLLPGYGAGLFALSKYTNVIQKNTQLTITKPALISFGTVSLMSMLTGNAFMIAGIATFAYYYKSEYIFNPSNILLGIMIPFYALSIALDIYGLALFLNVRFIAYENIYIKHLDNEKNNFMRQTDTPLNVEVSLLIKL